MALEEPADDDGQRPIPDLRVQPLGDLGQRHVRILLDPAQELVEEFVTAFHAELNTALAAETAERAARERDHAEVGRKLDGLIDAMAEGYRTAGLQAKLDALEGRKAALEAELAVPAPSPVRLHPNLGAPLPPADR